MICYAIHLPLNAPLFCIFKVQGVVTYVFHTDLKTSMVSAQHVSKLQVTSCFCFHCIYFVINCLLFSYGACGLQIGHIALAPLISVLVRLLVSLTNDTPLTLDLNQEGEKRQPRPKPKITSKHYAKSRSDCHISRGFAQCAQKRVRKATGLAVVARPSSSVIINHSSSISHHQSTSIGHHQSVIINRPSCVIINSSSSFVHHQSDMIGHE